MVVIVKINSLLFITNCERSWWDRTQFSGSEYESVRYSFHFVQILRRVLRDVIRSISMNCGVCRLSFATAIFPANNLTMVMAGDAPQTQHVSAVDQLLYCTYEQTSR
jgi:hypothetical protein